MYNPYSLRGKSILVTGASSGIGRAIAIECSKMGGRLLVTARNEGRLHETISNFVESDMHRSILADLSDEVDILRIVEAVEGKLDGVVLCAGIASPKVFSFISSSDISEVMSVNFNAPVILVKELLKRRN